MEFSVEFWIQIIVLSGGIAAIWGGQKQTIMHIRESIKRLEIKQDKHNALQERMSLVESQARSAHHRIEDTNKRIGKIENKCLFEQHYRDYYKEERQ